MAAELTITAAGAHTLVMVGELDTHTATQLAEQLESIADGTPLVLDVAGVSFISSAGLSAILTTQRRLDGSGGSLTLRSPTATVARLVELSGLSDTLGFS
ncbi:MAG: STAS domain-containing protein [Acidimicrobiales bacterium]